jgi:hypothetical protein
MRLFRIGAAGLAVLACWLGCLAADFRLITGDVYKGTLAAADKDGLIVRLESGEYSPRVDWAKLTDETLNQLVNDPKAKRFVEPFIEPPLEEIQKATTAAREIAVRQPQRVELPQTTVMLLPPGERSNACGPWSPCPEIFLSSSTLSSLSSPSVSVTRYTPEPAS